MTTMRRFVVPRLLLACSFIHMKIACNRGPDEHELRALRDRVEELKSLTSRTGDQIYTLKQERLSHKSASEQCQKKLDAAQLKLAENGEALEDCSNKLQEFQENAPPTKDFIGDLKRRVRQCDEALTSKEGAIETLRNQLANSDKLHAVCANQLKNTEERYNTCKTREENVDKEKKTKPWRETTEFFCFVLGVGSTIGVIAVIFCTLQAVYIFRQRHTEPAAPEYARPLMLVAPPEYIARANDGGPEAVNQGYAPPPPPPPPNYNAVIEEGEDMYRREEHDEPRHIRRRRRHSQNSDVQNVATANERDGNIAGPESYPANPGNSTQHQIPPRPATTQVPCPNNRMPHSRCANEHGGLQPGQRNPNMIHELPHPTEVNQN